MITLAILVGIVGTALATRQILAIVSDIRQRNRMLKTESRLREAGIIPRSTECGIGINEKGNLIAIKKTNVSWYRRLV